GKGLFAKKPIRKGETIFIERPLVSAQFLWNALYKYRACEYCLRSLETAEENARRLSGNPSLILPHPEQCRVRKELHQMCPQCQVMYCSSECRQAALDQYHRTLCLGLSQEDPEHPINKLQDAWRNMHFPPETSSIVLMARMVATVKQERVTGYEQNITETPSQAGLARADRARVAGIAASPAHGDGARNKGHWLNLFSQFCSRTANEEEEIAHKLLGEKFQGQLALLRNLFTTALYDDHLNRWFTPEGFLSLFALVGTNGQGIGTRYTLGYRPCPSVIPFKFSHGPSWSRYLISYTIAHRSDRCLLHSHSSLSQWVHGCDALELPRQQREQLDAFIDQLYKDIERETGDFLNCEGSGLFLLQSSCNHSCVPNAEASFPDNNFLLHLTALSDISPGEVRDRGGDGDREGGGGVCLPRLQEVCISYLDCCQRERSRHSRHKILRCGNDTPPRTP
ncbi:hypothetical protein JZ751_010644, partial [Albula glossodonta]